MFSHWKNLNEDHTGRKGWPLHGRAWLHYGDRRAIAFEWNLKGRSCGVSVGVDNEEGLKCHAAFPPFSVGLSFGFPRTEMDRDLSIRIFDWSIWWTVWRDPMGEWSRKVPRWREGNFNVRDFLLGRARYQHEILSTHAVVIPMPEGAYPATIMLERATWSRPRWVRRTIYRASVDIPGGIPHKGKGENSWDCGRDGLFGMTCPAATVEKAIAACVESVLKDRRRYDGNLMAKYEAPHV